MARAGQRILAIVLTSTLLAGSGWGEIVAPVDLEQQSATACACRCAAPDGRGQERCCCCCRSLPAEGTDAPQPPRPPVCGCRPGESPPMAPGQPPVELRLRAETPAGLASTPVGVWPCARSAMRGSFAWRHGVTAHAPPLRVLFCTWQT
ncbi:MAG TPA: hypothetical protein VML55_04305 [Planctomycetaceae bacterium]|nr:hypothetical protein [Planctomycetaceae bacterium]